MARIPIPTPEEQDLHAAQLGEIRDRLRRQVFESPTAAVEAVRLAGSQSPAAGRLRTLLAEWRREFERLWWGQIDPAEVAEIRRTILQYRQRSATELEGLALSPKAIHDIVREMEVLSSEMDRLLRGLDALREDSAARHHLEGRRRQLMSLALENARDLHARVGSIRGTLRDVDGVKHRIAGAHLRLVVLIARRYVRSGVPLVDLIQEGNLGLLKAVELFDPGLGYKFSTYAKWWIRESITRGVADQAGPFRVPVGASRLLSRLRRATHALSHRLERAPSIEEAATEAGIPPAEALRALRTLTGSASLEAPLGSTGRAKLGDLIEDKVARLPADPEGQIKVRTRIAQALGDLPERDRRVIELRFGLAGEREATRMEVARSFELSPERIRQIEAAALERLRTSMWGNELRALL
jgi:RNA polymerase sigma factor (sigma-70 family)